MATQALAVNSAKVYIVGRTEEKLNRVAELYGANIAGQIIPLTADTSRKASIAQLVEEFASREDHLSVLINNAGIAGQARQDVERQQVQHAETLREMLFDDESATEHDWESVYRTNVCQLYFMTGAFLPLLQKGTEADAQAQAQQEGGSGFTSTVINTTSISGIVKTSQHHFAYNASKAAAST